MPARGFWEPSATHTRRRPGNRGGPCPSAAGTRSSHGAPPGLSPPRQDLDTKSQENKDHIFPYEAERPALGKQWPCWDQRELGLDWGQKLSPSLIRMTTSSPPPVTKVWRWEEQRVRMRVDPSGPTPPSSRTPQLPAPPHPAQLLERSLTALPQASHVLAHSRSSLKFFLSRAHLLLSP